MNVLGSRGYTYSVQVFTEFKRLVENQFDAKIKVLQTDGGGEFVNNQMKQFLAANGIQHHLSCPYSPEQNGMAERRH